MSNSRLRHVTLALVLVGAPILSACTGGADSKSAPGVTMVGDTQVIRSAGAGRWAGTPRLVEELRIGVPEGDPAYLFGNVRSLAVLRDGSVLVADAQQPLLRLYAPDGRFLREIGREGAGPGEYRHLTGLQITRDGEIAPFDALLRRISFFDDGGTFLRSMNVEVGGSMSGNGLHQDTLGNLYLYGVGPSPRAAERMRRQGENALMGEAPGDLLRFHVKLSPRGEVLDTLLVPEWDRPRAHSFVIMTR